jgi:hypothetical protein
MAGLEPARSDLKGRARVNFAFIEMMVRSVGIEPTSNRVRTGSVSFQLRTHGAHDENRTRCNAVDSRALNRRASCAWRVA